MKKQKLPKGLSKLFVSRAAFASMQAKKQELEKDIYIMLLGKHSASLEVRLKYVKKFERDKMITDGLRLLAKKEWPSLKKKYPDIGEPKLDSNPGAFK